MPGTPTTLLGLQQPTTGGDIGTWGPEVNTNWPIIDSLAKQPINNVSASGALAFGPNDVTVFRVTTGSSVLTMTLPAAVAGNLGRIIRVIKVDSGVGTVRITGATVNAPGGPDYNLANQYQYVDLQSTGTGASYDVVGNN